MNGERQCKIIVNQIFNLQSFPEKSNLYKACGIKTLETMYNPILQQYNDPGIEKEFKNNENK